MAFFRHASVKDPGPCMTELEQIVHEIAAVVKKEQG